MPFPEDISTLGLALVLLYIVIKEGLPLIKGDKGNGLRQAEIRTKIEELHRWHAPDSSGQQSWKNQRVEDLLSRHEVILKDQLKEMHRHNNMLEAILKNKH